MKPTRRDRILTIAYWALTLIVALEMVAGSFWDLLHIEYVRVIMTHLGYPPYLLSILGAWKLPCGLALIAPRFPRLKEWAYAGAFFNYTGAAASHLFAGDAKLWQGPLLFAAMTVGSWALRPASRRLPGEETKVPVRPIEWMAAVALAVAMVILALATLPKGPPPP